MELRRFFQLCRPTEIRTRNQLLKRQIVLSIYILFSTFYKNAKNQSGFLPKVRAEASPRGANVFFRGGALFYVYRKRQLFLTRNRLVYYYFSSRLRLAGGGRGEKRSGRSGCEGFAQGELRCDREQVSGGIGRRAPDGAKLDGFGGANRIVFGANVDFARDTDAEHLLNRRFSSADRA